MKTKTKAFCSGKLCHNIIGLAQHDCVFFSQVVVLPHEWYWFHRDDKEQSYFFPDLGASTTMTD